MATTGTRALLWRSPSVRWAIAVLAIATIGAPPVVAQTTVLFFDSQDGDYIGGGGQQTFRPADGDFSISRNPANGVSLSIRDVALTLLWDLHFSGPGDAALAPGSYAVATRYPFTPFTGLSISGSGRACNELTGRYVVLEIEYAADGGVARFAADAEQHCEDHEAALFAAIRYNSTISDTTPFGGLYPRYELGIAPPQNGAVTGSGVSCGSGSTDCQETFSGVTLASMTATPDAGYTFMGWTGACNGARAMTVNVNSMKACGAMFAPIVPPAPRSILLWHSESGDYIGQADRQVYSPGNSVWSIAGTEAGNGVRLSIDSVDDRRASRWTLEFKAPAGQTLQPGMYDDISRAAFRTTTAGLEVYGNGRGCNIVTGAFVVHEVDIDPVSNVVSSLAVDFEHHCDQVPNSPLTGRLRINSSVDTRVRQVSLSPTRTVLPYTPESLITLGTELFPRHDVETALFEYTVETEWTEVKPYESQIFGWTPEYSDIGRHDFQVWARVNGSIEAYEAWAGATVTIVDPPHPRVTAVAPNTSGRLGHPVFFNVSAQGGVAPLEYKFLKRFAGVWNVVQEYGPTRTYTWSPGLSDIGVHDVQVWVRNHRSGALFESYGAVTYVVRPPPPLAVTLWNPSEPLPTGVPRQWVAHPQNAVGPLEYQFIRLDADGWHVVRPYAAGVISYSWTPSLADAGEHALQVWVRHVGSSAPYEAWASTGPFQVVIVPLAPVLTADYVFPVPTKTIIRWTVDNPGGTTSLQFQFWVWRDGSGWTLGRDYQDDHAFLWQPPAESEGTYVVQALVRRSGTTSGHDAFASSGYFDIRGDTPARIVGLTANQSFPAIPGFVWWTALATGGNAAPLEFQWVRLNLVTGVWVVVQPYSSSYSFSWTTTDADAGTYVLQVWVRSAGATVAYEGWAGFGPFTLQ